MRAWPLALFAACGVTPKTIVELPAHDPAFVLAVNDRTVFAGTSSTAIDLDVEVKKLEAAFYPQSFGLAPGVIPDLGVQCRSCALLTPRATFVREGASPSWRPSAPSDLLRQRLVPDAWPRCACSNLTASLVQIPLAESITIIAAVREANGSVLVVSDEGSIARIRPDRTTERVCTTSARTLAATIPSPGRLLLARGDTIDTLELAAQSPDVPCTASSSTAGAQISRGIKNLVADGSWIAAVAADGSVFSYDGAAFHELGTVPFDDRPRIAIGTGHNAIAISRDSDTLLYIEDAVARPETIAPGDTLDAVVYTADRGWIAALGQGGVATRVDGEWRVTAIDEWPGVSSLIPFGDALVTVAVHGKTRELSPHETRLCPAIEGFTGENVFVTAALGDDAYVLADIISNDPQPSAVGIVRRVPWCP